MTVSKPVKKVQMKRLTGYYKVLRRNSTEWEIGYYNNAFGTWSLIGTNIVYYEYEFRNIGKTLIKLP